MSAIAVILFFSIAFLVYILYTTGVISVSTNKDENDENKLTVDDGDSVDGDSVDGGDGDGVVEPADDGVVEPADDGVVEPAVDGVVEPADDVVVEPADGVKLITSDEWDQIKQKKGYKQECVLHEDCMSGFDCRGTPKKCLRRISLDDLPGADTTPVPGTNLGTIEEGDRFFIRNRHWGRCIGRRDGWDKPNNRSDLKASPVGYACRGEYKDPCNPGEDVPIEDQCSRGLICEQGTDGANQCLLNPVFSRYTEENLPRKECEAWTIPCDTNDENYHWTSIDVPGTNKQKFKAVGTDQCLAIRGRADSRGHWKNSSWLNLEPCDSPFIGQQSWTEWEKTAEPFESGIVNGEEFVPDPYFSIKSANPSNKCAEMASWNKNAPDTKPKRNTCSRSRKNAVMHFNFPIINS